MTRTVGEAMFAMSNNDEIERTPEYEMVCIAPDGIGYGEGGISANDRQNHPDYPVSKEQLMRAVDVLAENSQRIVTPIEEYDDGCGDGRPADKIQMVDPETGELFDFKVSKLRAKIFGGGLQVAASMWRSIVGGPKDGQTVLGDRKFMASELKKRDVRYGGHTDNNAQGESCGCGAIDKYPTSVKMSGEYRQEILGTLGLFYEDPSTHGGVQRAFAARQAIASDAGYMSNATGHETADFMIEDGAVIKELVNEHLEAVVILNDQPGTTIDQALAAQLLKEAGLPDKIQIFVVDVWRGREYASTVADIASELNYDRDEAYETAMADFYINQLSVATTLTKGDLPVIRNRQKSE
ncbi:MAG: hypothetical protein WBP12_04525 [Candidatus Saccharimonas sp.]